MTRRATTLIACLATVACGDLLGSGAEPGIQLSPNHVTDTIEAHVRILVVVRNERGNAVRNTQVNYAGWLWATTDDRGVASFDLRMPPTAGEQRGVVRWDEYRDTLLLTTLPGNAVGIVHVPPDTAVLVGAAFYTQVRRADRNGNARPEGVAISSTVSVNPSIAAASGSRVDAVAPGITEVRAHTAEGAAVLNVAVLPDAQLAVFPGPELVTPTGEPAGTLPRLPTTTCLRWHPDGDRFLTSGLRVIELDGTVTTIDTRPGMTVQCGDYSADGEWIYFAAAVAGVASGVEQIWRVRPDGTDLEQLTGGQLPAVSPTPSPDGSQLAYVYETVISTSGIVVLDVESGASDTILSHTEGSWVSAVEWSPTGDWIAYDDVTIDYHRRDAPVWASLHVMRPDGSGRRWIGAGERLKLGWSWSPDGRWLVATEDFTGRLLFIDVEQGRRALSTAQTSGFLSPVWRPQLRDQ